MKAQIKISIVDDQPSFRATISNIMVDFPRFNFIGESNNGKIFIESLIPGIIPDVVILDLKTDQEETTSYLKKNFPYMKILIPGMYTGEIADRHKSKSEIHDFFIKETLQQYVEQAKISLQSTGKVFSEFIIRKILTDFQERDMALPEDYPELLSLRETQIVSLICNGYTRKEMAEILSIELSTVNTFIKRVVKKIRARTKSGIISYGINHGIKDKFGYPSKNVEKFLV